MEVFKPSKRKSGQLLWRERPRDNLEFVCFSTHNSQIEVYIHYSVLVYVQQQAQQMAPNETIGLLGGRVCEDYEGPYTLVSAAEGAKANDLEIATPGHVRISGHGQALVRSRLVAAHPITEIVGWYHSHPQYEARFSTEDLREQSTWSNPYHIGLVISGLSSSEPFGMYCGPQAINLELKQPQQITHLLGKEPNYVKIDQNRPVDPENKHTTKRNRANLAVDSQPAQIDALFQPKKSTSHKSQDRSSLRRRFLSWFIIIILAILGGIGLLLVGFNNFARNNPPNESSSQITSLPAKASDAFSCDSQDQANPLTIKCIIETEVQARQWIWEFGDEAVSRGRAVEHTYNHAGSYTVTLIGLGVGQVITFTQEVRVTGK